MILIAIKALETTLIQPTMLQPTERIVLVRPGNMKHVAIMAAIGNRILL